ncbi:MAG: hypothetical protein ABI970_18425, partial [Chloroflexota bacterium]
DLYLAAAQIFDDISYFVAQPDVTLVHWAQFMSSIAGAGDVAMGLVDLEGHKRASYNAFEIYARLPIEQRSIIVPDGFGALAASNKTRAGIVVWNHGDEDVDLQFSLHNLPFTAGKLRVYAIDAEHSSHNDNPQTESLEVIEEHDFNQSNDTLSGTIKSHGVLYFELDQADRVPVQQASFTGEIVRLHHYYPDRGTTTYAEFDRSFLTAYLGMGASDNGYALVGMTVDNLPNLLSLSLETEGNFTDLNTNSLLGLRIDYANSSVLFHNGLYHTERDATIPWGTGRQADIVVQLTLSDPIALELKKYAPVNWDGRAVLSFIMQNTGAQTRARFTLG